MSFIWNYLWSYGTASHETKTLNNDNNNNNNNSNDQSQTIDTETKSFETINSTDIIIPSLETNNRKRPLDTNEDDLNTISPLRKKQKIDHVADDSTIIFSSPSLPFKHSNEELEQEKEFQLDNIDMKIQPVDTAMTRAFLQIQRGMSKETLYTLLDDCWHEDSIQTVKLLFYIRDIHEGQGERLLFREGLEWLRNKDLLLFNKVLVWVPFYGRWDDVLFFPEGIQLMATQLKKDQQTLELMNNKKEDKDDNFNDNSNNNNDSNMYISLAAKWMPTENHRLDKQHKFVKKLCRAMNVSRKIYRTKYQVPLRKHLQVVERHMCNNEWEQIEFSRVPQRAMELLSRAFHRHVPEKFQEYLSGTCPTATTTTTTNAVTDNTFDVFLPHSYTTTNMIHKLSNLIMEKNQIEWNTFINEYQSHSNTRALENCIPVLSTDLKDSKFLNFATGITLLSTELQSFKHFFIDNECFYAPDITSQFPTYVSTCVSKLVNQNTTTETSSIDIESLFDKLLQEILLVDKYHDSCPKYILIMTRQGMTNIDENIIQKYKLLYQDCGLQLPTCVYWKLDNSNPLNKHFIERINTHCIQISGSNSRLIHSCLECTEFDTLHMNTIVQNILESPRYSLI